MEIQKEAIKPTPLFAWTMRLAGTFIAIIVIFLYTKAAQGGPWPASHPWSGIAMSLLAFSLFSSSNSRKGFKVVGYFSASLAVISAILWSISAR